MDYNKEINFFMIGFKKLFLIFSVLSSNYITIQSITDNKYWTVDKLSELNSSKSVLNLFEPENYLSDWFDAAELVCNIKKDRNFEIYIFSHINKMIGYEDDKS
jgi:hypothetical protein